MVLKRGLYCNLTNRSSRRLTRNVNVAFAAFAGIRLNVQNTVIAKRTGLDSLLSSIHRRRLAIFGHVRRLTEATPAHVALKLAVDIRSDRTPYDDGNDTQWRRPSGRPRYTWVQQLEADTGLTADDLWNIASDRDAWRALRVRTIAGQVDQ